MVRNLAAKNFRPPWPLIKKGALGQRKVGPQLYEKPLWPGTHREFPELHPKLFKLNPKPLHNYTHVPPTGFEDARSGEFVRVPEMAAELVVPDLDGFDLKPYVSYRTDVDIEKRRQSYAKAVRKHGSEEAADAHTEEWTRWPPPAASARTLFDLHYRPRIREEFKKKQK
ncbi:39S ribosomal protein L41, mitochondrial [Aphelenchoides fujianensis]|nr:39S ribosomal protein L41, mitochondrial [Aphelenchoides fujianensis]